MASKALNKSIPVCSICIANYNGMAFIKDCLYSIQRQQIDFPIEIIVHDDASSDDSVSFIREHFPEVILIASKRNVGFCTSNNRMVALARGEYILLLNNDAELLPDALKVLYQHAEKNDTHTILGIPQYDYSSGELIDRGIMFDLFLNPIPNLCQKQQEVGMIVGACLWLSKSLWVELGGFPEWFDSLAEDMYICCLARLKGYSIKILNSSGFRHHVGASFGGGKIIKNRLSTSVARRAKSERNKTFVMVLTYPSPVFETLFPLHLIWLLLEGVMISIVKRNSEFCKKIYLYTFKELWKRKKTLIALRRSIQSSVKIKTWGFFIVFTIIPYKIKMLLKHGIPELKN